ncbi:hypothetical protein SEUCBS139899_009494 [Sporothrix eucalyptigena]|uniref:Aspergillopepsin n=1 Tax=Sporothrix eucalyptigena TaxID=1812306 RepID=A0ABP0CJV0_9PEZI
MRLSSTLAVALFGVECILASPVVLAPRTSNSLQRRERQRTSNPRLSSSPLDGVNIALSKNNKSTHTVGSGNSTSNAGNKAANDVKYSSNWSGAIVKGSGFQTVTGTIAVPLPKVPSGGSTDTYYSASAWVGFDGDSGCSSTILQVGIDFNIQNGQVSYDAWYEWYPDYAYNFVGFDLHAGDVVTLTATATSSTSGAVLIENETTGKSVTHSFSGESSPLCGLSAEWIVEDYMVAGSLVEMADFGRATFTGCSATESSGVIVGLGNASIYDISNNGAVMTDCSKTGTSVVSCAYVS